MFRPLFIALLLCSFCVPAARADLITGVTVTTTIPVCCGLAIENIVNGSGLSSYDPSATHSASGNWIGTRKTGTLHFDLHGEYLLNGIAVFNSAFGVKEYDLAISTDGATFINVPGFPVSLMNVSTAHPTTAEIHNFQPMLATHVRMTLLDGYSVFDNTALKEVMFLSAVPEPSAVSMLSVLVVTGFIYVGVKATGQSRVRADRDLHLELQRSRGE